MKSWAAFVTAGIVLAALAGWPAFVAERSASADESGAAPAVAATLTPAPVTPDYVQRDHNVAFYERAVHRSPHDQIIARLLAGQYLMRFRERGDIGDLRRARLAAQRSLSIQPHENGGAEGELASVALALHQFRDARRYDGDVVRMQPWSSSAVAALASTDMELGDYARAATLLARPPSPYLDASWESTVARYEEVTGHLSAARVRLARGMQQVDSVFDNPAEARAWYHFRAGELAFEAGDLSPAERDFKDAIAIFPSDAKAYNSLARIYCAEHRWRDALTAATHGAALVPLPETLGYQADAQRALGDREGSRETADLIGAIERIGNSYGVNDRAIAVYESEHRVHLHDALTIAKRDAAARDDLFAEDTLAWALAMNGEWESARPHAERAIATGIEDSRIQFHAGVIALKTGHVAEARDRLQQALVANPYFHPVYADEARRLLGSMR